MTVACSDDNEFDGRLGLRIGSIFVIFIGAFVGCWLPVHVSRRRNIKTPARLWTFAKYFGSGVIAATAFIHVGQGFFF
jgi:zinc transporter 1/2/3